VVDTEFPYEIVQRGPKAVHNVRENETGVAGGGFSSRMTYQDDFGPTWAAIHRHWSRGCRVYESSDYVRVDLHVLIENVAQGVQVMSRAVEPRE
jgi:hypothetical protein